VYGEAERYPRSRPIFPSRSPYGAIKLAAEHLCGLYGDVGRPTVSLQITSLSMGRPSAPTCPSLSVRGRPRRPRFHYSVTAHSAELHLRRRRGRCQPEGRGGRRRPARS
jgi:hypothetical protein